METSKVEGTGATGVGSEGRGWLIITFLLFSITSSLPDFETEHQHENTMFDDAVYVGWAEGERNRTLGEIYWDTRHVLLHLIYTSQIIFCFIKQDGNAHDTIILLYILDCHRVFSSPIPKSSSFPPHRKKRSPTERSMDFLDYQFVCDEKELREGKEKNPSISWCCKKREKLSSQLFSISSLILIVVFFFRRRRRWRCCCFAQSRLLETRNNLADI